MVAAGLQVINDNGIVQIDDSYQNYHVVATGTLTANTRTYFPAQAEPAIVLIGDTSGYLATLEDVYSDSFFVIGNSYGSAAAVNYTASYAVITRAAGISDSGVGTGLRVWDAGGALAFDSGRDVLKITSSNTVAASTIYAATYNGVVINCPSSSYVSIQGSRCPAGTSSGGRFTSVLYGGIGFGGTYLQPAMSRRGDTAAAAYVTFGAFSTVYNFVTFA